MNESQMVSEPVGYDDGRSAPDVPADTNDVDMSAQQLLALLDGIEEFLAQQFQRLQMMFNLLGESFDEEAPYHAKYLEQQKQLWEQERSAERRRLQEEGETLIRAWKKLEDEQRRVLGMKESLAAGRTIRSQGATADLPTSDQTAAGAEQMALSQFQELRREIQSHARRRS